MASVAVSRSSWFALFRGFILRPLLGAGRTGDRLRTLLSILAVGLGVGVIVAIQLANRSSIRSFEGSLEEISGRTNLSIAGVNGLDERLLPQLSELAGPGVKISPVLESVAVVAANGEVMRVLGVDILEDKSFRDVTLTDRGFFGTDSLLTLLDPKSLLVSESFAKRHQLKLGSPIALLVNDHEDNYIVRGVLAPQGAAKAMGGSFALMDIAAAQLAFGRLGKLDRVDLIVPPEQLASLETTLPRQLPLGLRVERPLSRIAQADKMLRAFRWNLAALSYVSLIVGAFLIYNTVAISVVRRRAEIGTLRSLGTTRGRVLRLFLSEALVLGVAGGLAGIGLGRALAGLALRLVSRTVNALYLTAPPQPVRLDLALATEALGIALVAAFFSALLPALEATGVSPAEALQHGAHERQRRLRTGRYAAAGIFTLALALGAALLPAVRGFPFFGYVSALLLVAAFSLLMPLLLQLSMAVLDGPLGRLAGVEGQMAGRGLAASPSRISILTMALATAVAMMASVAIMVGSFRKTVEIWAQETLRADLFLKPAAQRADASDATISPDAIELIRSAPGVEAVDPFRGLDINYNGNPAVLGSGDWRTLIRRGNLLFVDGRSPAQVLTDPERQAAVSEPFAIHNHIRKGQQITIATPSGDARFEVCGIYYDYSNDRGTIVIDREQYRRLFGDDTATALAVYLRPGANSEEVRSELWKKLGAHNYRFFITPNAILQQNVLRVFDRTFSVTYALEIVAIAVAALGIANALLALVIERRRELGILRVLGATRAQLKKIILTEAALVGLFGNLAGWLMGLLLSLVLVFVINKQSFGWTIQFHYPAAFLALSGAAILLVTIAAGLYPARVAARMIPSEVISIE
jgi:putative ABC transport system permease protein